MPFTRCPAAGNTKNVAAHQHAIVQALPGLGGCLSAAKAGGSYYPYKSKMSQKTRAKASPRGSWPQSGLKGQGMEDPALPFPVWMKKIHQHDIGPHLPWMDSLRSRRIGCKKVQVENDSNHRPPEVRGAVANGDWGAVRSYKPEMR